MTTTNQQYDQVVADCKEIFLKKAKDYGTAKKIYDGLQPLTAEDVADVIFYTTTLPAHVCINDLTISCLQQANAIYFNRQSS